MNYVRVRKDEYESPTVRNGWVSKEELRAYRGMLRDQARVLEDRAELGDNFSADQADWFHRVRNRELLRVNTAIDRLTGVGIDVYESEAVPS